jgi:RNA polymerase sigma-70 factor, ECF subfamily
MVEENTQYQQLMRKSLEGDKAAYEQLLKESARLVKPFLSRYLKGNAEAEDVLQEVLLSVHKAKHTYDGNRPYKPWLFAIAKFRLQDYLRRHYSNKLRNTIDLADVEDILAAPVTKPTDTYEEVRDSINELPGKQAKIVELMHIDGYTAKEVGVKLGMKESAVKVAAHRAYKKLREKLGKA